MKPTDSTNLAQDDEVQQEISIFRHTSSFAAACFSGSLLLIGLVLLGINIWLINLNNAATMNLSLPWRVGLHVNDVIGYLSYALLGSLLIMRRPAHPIGWLFCFKNILGQVFVLTEEYAIYGILTQPEALSFSTFVAWIYDWLWIPVNMLDPILLLLFPTGRLLSPRWKWAVWFTLFVMLQALIVRMFYPGPLRNLPLVINPFGNEIIKHIRDAGDSIYYNLLVLPLVVASLSLILRFHSAKGSRRNQLKWIAYATALNILVAPFRYITPLELNSVIVFIGTLAVIMLPVSITIAILRYKLFDIDLIINRTLVYGLLTTLLVAAYYGSVILLQALLYLLTRQQQSELVIVASTLVTVVLFNPLRHRIQAFIDRRFYRQKYDATRILAGFSAKLRHQIDLDDLQSEIVAVAQTTLQPRSVSLWLRPAVQPYERMNSDLLKDRREREGR